MEMISRLEDAMSTVTDVNVQKPASPLSVRNFRLLWIGEGISLLGDQFYLIALPWLVLQLTGSALALGTILALASIPRAVFMLVGGAFVDRYSPRSVMIWSNFARFVLVALLAVLVLTTNTQMWMLYVLALAFGLADAFYFPAQTAIVPQLLSEDQLQAGNTFVQGTAQLSLFLGPMLAGALIALLGHGTANGVPDMRGIGIAFGLDTLSFVASLLTLIMMRVPGVTKRGGDQLSGDGAGDGGYPCAGEYTAPRRRGSVRDHHVGFWRRITAGHHSFRCTATAQARAFWYGGLARGFVARRWGCADAAVRLDCCDSSYQSGHRRGSRLPKNDAVYVAAKAHSAGAHGPGDEPAVLLCNWAGACLERPGRCAPGYRPEWSVHRQRRVDGGCDAACHSAARDPPDGIGDGGH